MDQKQKTDLELKEACADCAKPVASCVCEKNANNQDAVKEPPKEPQPSGAPVLNEDKIIMAIEKGWLVLDALNGLLWLVTGITAATLFITQGYALSVTGGSPGFIMVCYVLGAIAAAIAFHALTILLTSTSLLFNLFAAARLILEARRKATLIPILKVPPLLSIAYCLESEGKKEEAERLFDSVKDKRDIVRKISPLCWGLALDAFAEWLDGKNLVLDKEKWTKAWERSQMTRHLSVISLIVVSLALFQTILSMLPGLAASLASPQIANYPAAANALSIFIRAEHIAQPDNKTIDSYRGELAQYQILSGQYATAEATLRQLITDSKSKQINDDQTREHVRWLSRLLEQSGRGQDAENLYKESMSAPGLRSPLELLLFSQFYLDRGDLETAASLLKQGLQLPNLRSEESAELTFRLGLIAMQQSNFAEAQTNFQKALEFVGSAPEASRREAVYKLALMEAQFNLGHHQEAIAQLDNIAARLDNLTAAQQANNADLYLALAQTYNRVHEVAKATKYMEMAVKWTSSTMNLNNPARASYLIELAEMYYTGGNYEKAQPLLNTAHELLAPLHNDPQLPRCLIDLGALAEKRLQRTQSKAYFSNAIDQLTRTGIHELPQSTLDELSAFRDSLSNDDKNATAIDKIFSAAKRNRFTQPPLKHG